MHRRDILLNTAAVAGISSITGCSALGGGSSATLDRIVLRSDTGQRESVELTLVYAPESESTERPVWGTYEAPASGNPSIIDDFEAKSGFYSLTAYSGKHGNLEVVSFNSNGDAVDNGPLQFEIVVQPSGDVWANLNELDGDISTPK